MLLFMEKLYDMHCHVGFAPAPATVAAEGAQAGIGALSCTVEPTEYEQLRAALADAPNVAVALGAHPWWIADGRVGETELARFCELARTTRFIGEIGLDFAGPRDTEESRALQTSAFACILATCNESAAPLAPTNPEGATATSGQNRTCIATTSPHPQRHRHCAEAHLHPRHQCRRSSTRCARTSQHLCAASRDLSLVLRHFR